MQAALKNKIENKLLPDFNKDQHQFGCKHPYLKAVNQSF
jgi:hypothetical protein